MIAHWRHFLNRGMMADVLPRDPLVVEMIQLFARFGSLTFDRMFDGFGPRWAATAYGFCLEQGLLEEDRNRRVTVTAAGWQYYQGAE